MIDGRENWGADGRGDCLWVLSLPIDSVLALPLGEDARLYYGE